MAYVILFLVFELTPFTILYFLIYLYDFVEYVICRYRTTLKICQQKSKNIFWLASFIPIKLRRRHAFDGINNKELIFKDATNIHEPGLT